MAGLHKKRKQCAQDTADVGRISSITTRTPEQQQVQVALHFTQNYSEDGLH
jgi:hypothetical protein